jgi:glycogen debranching enzyme
VSYLVNTVWSMGTEGRGDIEEAEVEGPLCATAERGTPARAERDVPRPRAIDAAPGSSGFGADSPEHGGQVLVEGATFVVSGPGGDIDGAGQGLFVRDARIISRWCLRIDGAPVSPLGGFRAEPFAGVFVGRSRIRDGHLEPTVLVERRRYVGSGMREDLFVRNYGKEPAGVSVSLEIAADFADLFAVKLGQQAPGSATVHRSGEKWAAVGRHGAHDRAVHVRGRGAAVTDEGLTWRAVVAPHQEWRTSVTVVAEVDGHEVPMRFPVDTPVDLAAPARRIAEWQRASPKVRSESLALGLALRRSEEDLASLQLADPTDPELKAIAAGAPWFMALFGRDSLITSALTLALGPELAVGSLRALARHQGQTVDALSEEEPGKILHELRFGADVSFTPGGTERYYGSVDATPLFVMVLGQLERWGIEREVIDELLPAADAALAWIERYGDRDGDGYVEYRRSTDRGLRNQGWKDSADGVNYADGSWAEPPIALVEVQAYVYGAFMARAELAHRRGDRETADHWAHRAAVLKHRFNADFWLADRGYFAVGLDAQKRPIDALTSNMGHALWTGIAEHEKASAVAERLCSAELFSGYGIRTLATSMGAYNPASYHNGSVWPHDTALCIAGLARYGFWSEAQWVASGLLEAAAYFAGRLPELFCGFDRRDVPGPVPYPASCSPQAWAAAAPIGMLTALLGLDPDVPGGVVRLRPALPPEWGAVSIEDFRLGAHRLSLDVAADGTLTCAAPPGLQLRVLTASS